MAGSPDTETADARRPNVLVCANSSVASATMKRLNQMRKNGQFCDVILQAGSKSVMGHRAVLAAASPYLFDLFRSETSSVLASEIPVSYRLDHTFDWQALEMIVEYCYTAKLEIPEQLVKGAYVVAARLRMEELRSECARFMLEHLSPDNCLGIRSIQGIKHDPDFADAIDNYIRKEISSVSVNNEFTLLPSIQVEVLQFAVENWRGSGHGGRFVNNGLFNNQQPDVCGGNDGGSGSGGGGSRSSSGSISPVDGHPNQKALQHVARVDLSSIQPYGLSLMVLDFIKSQVGSDESTLDELAKKVNLLFFNNADNILRDCNEMEEGAEVDMTQADCEMVQDYRLASKKVKPPKKRLSQGQNSNPSKPRHLLYSRTIPDIVNADQDPEWKVLATKQISDCHVATIAALAGTLFKISIRTRVTPLSPSETPNSSRPSSIEGSEGFVMVPPMSSAKCALGAGNLDGKLVVCGGYDRGDCLKTAMLYDPKTNRWTDLPSMLEHRGRLDIAVVDGRVYAVGGSSGNKELMTAEMYDNRKGAVKWQRVPSCRLPRASCGVCAVDGKVYCIGGWDGQIGFKDCEVFDIERQQWSDIAPLATGRYQAGVCTFRGEIWVIGGCESWGVLSSVEIYNPKTETWRPGPPISVARRGCGVAEFKGKLWVIGGTDGPASLFSTEYYDPDDRKWREGPNLTVPRGNVAAVAIGDRLYAVGGFTGKTFLNTVEFLDYDLMEFSTFLPSPATTMGRRESMSLSMSPSSVSAIIPTMNGDGPRPAGDIVSEFIADHVKKHNSMHADDDGLTFDDSE